MKNSGFLRAALVLLIGFSFISFVRAVCDNDDSPFDFLCKSNDVFQYAELFLNPLDENVLSPELYHHDSVSRQFIAFLSRYEKSPPQDSCA